MDARKIETWRMCIDIVRRFHDPKEPTPADVLASAVEELLGEVERLRASQTIREATDELRA